MYSASQLAAKAQTGLRAHADPCSPPNLSTMVLIRTPLVNGVLVTQRGPTQNKTGGLNVVSEWCMLNPSRTKTV